MRNNPRLRSNIYCCPPKAQMSGVTFHFTSDNNFWLRHIDKDRNLESDDKFSITRKTSISCIGESLCRCWGGNLGTLCHSLCHCVFYGQKSGIFYKSQGVRNDSLCLVCQTYISPFWRSVICLYFSWRSQVFSVFGQRWPDHNALFRSQIGPRKPSQIIYKVFHIFNQKFTLLLFLRTSFIFLPSCVVFMSPVS